MSTTENTGVSEAATATEQQQQQVSGGFDAVLQDFTARHLERYRQPLTIALMAGYCVVFLLSLAGNLLVLIVVLSNRAMRTTTNYFLVNLSVADLLGTLHFFKLSIRLKKM